MEIDYQSGFYLINNSSHWLMIYSYLTIFCLILLGIAHKLKIREFSILVAGLSVFYLILFLTALSTVHINSLFVYLAQDEAYPLLLLVFRWISIAAMYIVSFLLYKLIHKLNEGKRNRVHIFNMGLLVFSILYFLSADLDSIAMLITGNGEVLVHTQKTGYAILWGLSSFLLMILGMKRKDKILRIMSLILFAITIIKLFVYDISNISEGGKIAAFIFLGLLLLIISFMYQKVKKLVIDDEVKEIKEEGGNENE